jgi:hypothetical protein
MRFGLPPTKRLRCLPHVRNTSSSIGVKRIRDDIYIKLY